MLLKTCTLGRAATRLSALTAYIHELTDVLNPVLPHRDLACQPIFSVLTTLRTHLLSRLIITWNESQLVYLLHLVPCDVANAFALVPMGIACSATSSGVH